MVLRIIVTVSAVILVSGCVPPKLVLPTISDISKSDATVRIVSVRETVWDKWPTEEQNFAEADRGCEVFDMTAVLLGKTRCVRRQPGGFEICLESETLFACKEDRRD